MMALGIAPIGKEMEIKRIVLDEKTTKHLLNLGLMVGSKVTTLSDAKGDVILKVKDGRLALNKELAMRIFVA
ncbi:MAG: ferrous iron transport protein A [Acidaminococcus sp.]|nr:ferrous iron transport protein A [Acidaminococcus sp.]MDD7398558.1 FeoA family protein [Bacillota bacterium]MDY4559181.1 FeoA family protein [Eubacteriales bacterium]MDY5345720.1 FeoA family protein [Eubacteriales bacterium]